MKNVVIIVLLLLLVLKALACSQEQQQSKTLKKYPEFSWDHIPRYMHVYKRESYTEEEIKFLAGYPLITFEKAQGVSTGSVQKGTMQAARAVKKCNPNATILYYKNIIIDWPGSVTSKRLESIQGGYLKSKDGSYPVVNEYSGAKFFDISLPDVQDWWIKDATRILAEASIDGIFIDANIKVLDKRYFARGRKTGEQKAEQLIEGYHRILARIEKELRPDNIILANLIRARFKDGGLGYLHHFDGSYLENFELPIGKVSRVDYIAQGIAHTQTAARQGKIIAFTAGLGESKSEDSSGIGLDEARNSIKSLDSINDRLNYLTAIFLVIAEKYSYFYPYDQYVVHRTNARAAPINRTWLRTLPVFEKKLGPPTGPATKNGYIYTREFEHCSVSLDIENETGRLDWK